MKMWGGRFEKEPEGGLLSFTSSLGFDVRLYPYDIKCTGAWVVALAHAGLLTTDEEMAVARALEQVKEEFEAGSFEFFPTDEDIHTAIERRVVEITGPSGGKVRTGRSRNDQVATDMRLFVMEQCENVSVPVSYTHLRAHETRHDLVCRLLLEKKKKKSTHEITTVTFTLMDNRQSPRPCR